MMGAPDMDDKNMDIGSGGGTEYSPRVEFICPSIFFIKQPRNLRLFQQAGNLLTIGLDARRMIFRQGLLAAGNA